MAIYVCDNPPPPGIYGPLRIYKDRGRTIACTYHPLDGDRVKHAPEFAGTRKHAAFLAQAAPLASAAYSTLPAARKRAHYQQLAGKAIQGLKAGKSVAEVHELLLEAVEAIRREWKREKIQALPGQRKTSRKPVFCLPAPVSPPAPDRNRRIGRRNRILYAAATAGCSPPLFWQ